MIIISILYPDINFVINVSYAVMYYNYSYMGMLKKTVIIIIIALTMQEV